MIFDSYCDPQFLKDGELMQLFMDWDGSWRDRLSEDEFYDAVKHQRLAVAFAVAVGMSH